MHSSNNADSSTEPSKPDEDGGPPGSSQNRMSSDNGSPGAPGGNPEGNLEGDPEGDSADEDGDENAELLDRFEPSEPPCSPQSASDSLERRNAKPPKSEENAPPPQIDLCSETLLQEGDAWDALRVLQHIHNRPAQLMRLTLLRAARDSNRDPWARQTQAVLREEILGAWLPASHNPPYTLESNLEWTIPWYDAARGHMREVSLEEVVRIDVFPFEVQHN